jgi:hypothetical protein
MSPEGPSLRRAWLVPAAVCAVLCVGVVQGLRLFADDDEPPAGLPRSPASSVSSGAPSAAALSSEPPSEDPVARLHLRGDGLDMVGLGDPQLDVTRTLTDVLGPPDEEGDEPCTSHPEHQSHWVRWAGLSLRFDGGTFAGWIEGVHFPPGPQALDLPTATGLSPGDPLDRARQLYPGLRVRHTTAPGQRPADTFSFHDPDGTPAMFGLVEGEGSDQLVASIYAGDLC